MEALELNYSTHYGNKLIADFMGWVHHKDPEYDEKEMKSLKYHESWDWIMAVVLRLNDKSVEVTIHYKNTKIEWGDEDNSYDPNSGVKAETKILSVWTAVIHFLEWVRDNEIDLDNPSFYQ